MTHKDLVLYSWRNNTKNISYFLEFKDLLNSQKKLGNTCSCIVSNNNTFKITQRNIRNLEKIHFI